MSIAILNDVYSEVRRLAIAGSVVAPGDFRLQKLIEPLRKAGEKAPVLKRVADCAEQVVQATEKTAAVALLELASLLTSILYTQGTIGVEGELEELPPSTMDLKQTQTSARVLKPLLEALTSTGSGRLEPIKAAYQLHLFNDLRLVRPTLQAIDDSYSEIRDFIADNVLPTYGRAILPELRNSFDVNGKAGHGRRLKLMHRIAPQETRELVLKALENGSKDVKIVAIECLGDSEEDLNYLVEQAQSRAKAVRAAAYRSLSRLGNATAEERLLQALDTKDVELLFPVATDLAPPTLLQAALQRAGTELSTLLTLTKKTDQKPAVARLQWLIRIGTAQLNKPAERFLMQLLDQATSLAAIKSDPGGKDLIGLALEQLSEGSSAAVNYLVKHREQIPADQWPYMLRAARRRLKPAKFFDLFSPYLNPGAKKKAEDALRSEAVQDHVADANRYADYFDLDPDFEEQQTPLDPRWLDLAIKQDNLNLVCTLAKVKHAKLSKYLSAKWDLVKSNKSLDSKLLVAAAMVDSAHPDATSVVLGEIDAKKSSSPPWYHVNRWSRIASRLPSSVTPQLEAIVGDPKTSNQWSNALLEAIQTIRERGEK